MKTICILSTLLFFASCGGGGGSSSNKKSSGNGTQISLEEISNEGNTPLAADTFEIKLNLKGFNDGHTKKIHEAKDLIKQVIASQEFKDKILNHRYKGKKQFVDNGGLTNAQIYQKILEANEKLTPGKDNKMDLYLETYSDNKSDTVGYTYKNVRQVWMNTKYLIEYSAPRITTNMVHEWLHKLGFDHDNESTARRPHSVPYAVGYIVRDLAFKI